MEKNNKKSLSVSSKKRINILSISTIIILVLGVISFTYFFPQVSIIVSNKGYLEYSKLSLFPMTIEIKDKNSEMVEQLALKDTNGTTNLEIKDGIYDLNYSVGNSSQAISIIIDTTAPELELSTEEYSGKEISPITVTVSEEATIILNDSEGNNIKEYKKVSGTEHIDVPLAQEGENAFVISATDRYGNSSENEIIVKRDMTNPTVKITAPANTTFTQKVSLSLYSDTTTYLDPNKLTKTINVEFTADDTASGVKSVSVNGKTLKLTKNNKYTYALKLKSFVTKTCSEYYDTKINKTDLNIIITDNVGNKKELTKTYTFKQVIGDDCGFGI